jgi:hypothetical protein
VTRAALELPAEAREELSALLEHATLLVEIYCDELRGDVESGDGSLLDAYEGAKETAAELRRVLSAVRPS